MKSVLWRQADQFGVFYTEDREHLQRLLALDRFPLKREEDVATYRNARGRVFAWQASFDLTLWNRVVRALGRSEVDIQLEEGEKARRPAKSSLAATPSAPPSVSRPRTRSVARTPALPVIKPARPVNQPRHRHPSRPPPRLSARAAGKSRRPRPPHPSLASHDSPLLPARHKQPPAQPLTLGLRRPDALAGLIQ